jgi:hypothetical protein
MPWSGNPISLLLLGKVLIVKFSVLLVMLVKKCLVPDKPSCLVNILQVQSTWKVALVNDGQTHC